MKMERVKNKLRAVKKPSQKTASRKRKEVLVEPIENTEVIFDSKKGKTDDLFIDVASPAEKPVANFASFEQRETRPPESPLSGDETAVSSLREVGSPKTFWQKIKKLFSLNNKFFSLLVGLVSAGIFIAGFYVLAVPPDSKYAPGATLDPNCAAGSANCSVTAAITANESITLSGDISGTGTTAITTAIGNDKVTEAMLKAVDTASDEDVFTYESTTGDFEWHSPAELKTSMSLNSVENTALSTWAGTANITTVGTIGTGTWNATAIGVAKGGTALTTIAAGSILAANSADTLSAITSTSGTKVLTNTTGTITWETQATTAHNLLSATHGDSTTAAAVRGDLITGQGASPLWTRLAKGTAGQILTTNADDVVWSTATYPATTTINQLLYSSSANVVAGLATANGGILNAGATGVPAMTVTPVLGVAGTSTGTIGLSGITSGVVTIQPAAAAGTWSLTLPTTDGDNLQFLQTNGSGVTTWATALTSVTAHNLLSATHGDSTTAAAVRGDLITGQGASPTWTRLAKGTAGQILTTNADDVVWSTATYPATAATTGAYLRADGTNWISSTLILPNAGTAYKLAAYTATNTLTELAAVGATGEYLAGATGAIPVWATLNQAAVAGLTTTDSPTFANLTLSTAGAVRTSTTLGNTLLLQAYDTDTGPGYTTFATLTAGTTPTFDLSTATTIGTAYIYRAGGTDVAVADGGTGKSSWTQWGIPYADTTTSLSQVASGSAGQILTSGGSGAPVWTTATYPATAATTGAYLRADGTNWISSTLILPNAGTAYKLAAYTATNTLTELAAVGSTGQILQGNTGAIPSWSTATYPATATGTGTILRADGTNWVATTATYPATTTINQLLYSSSANVVAGLATANGGILNAGATGVPAMTVTPVLGVAGTSTGTIGLSGITSGVVTIQPAAAAGTWTMTLPVNDGDNGQVLTTNGSGVTSWGAGGAGAWTFDATPNNLYSTEAGNGTMTGTDNIFAGSGAGVANTIGNYNNFVGSGSGYSNNEGVGNNFFGYQAGYTNTMSGGNDFFGYQAGYTNTGTDNVFMGYQSGYSNSGGTDNTAIGYQAFKSNTYATKNVAIGALALYTQSYANGNSAWITGNVAIGYEALYSNQPTSNTNGYYNTAVGYQAGRSNATGSNDVFLGYTAGYYETGSNKLFIDNQARSSESDGRIKALVYGVFAAAPADQTLQVNGSLILGPMASATGSTKGQLYYDSDNDNLYLYNGGWVTVTTSSSLRYKNNVQPFETDFLTILHAEPKSFEYKGSSNEEIGYIAEDFDALGLGDLVIYDDKGRPNGIKYDRVSLYLLEVIKQQQLDIDALKLVAGVNLQGSYSASNTIVQQVQKLLADTGIAIKDGITSINSLVTNTFATKTARINQIEMVDKTTGDIYCTWIEGGEWKRAKGDCSQIGSASVSSNLPESETPAGPDQTVDEKAKEIVEQAKQVAKQAQQASNEAKQASKQAQQAAEQISQQIDQKVEQKVEEKVEEKIEEQLLNIASAVEIADMNVDFGAAMEQLNLPQNADVTLADGSTRTLAVTWDSGEPFFDGNTPGAYQFSGELALADSVTNTANIKAKVKVIVAEKIEEPLIQPPAEEIIQPEIQPEKENNGKSENKIEDTVSPVSDAIQEAAAGLLEGFLRLIKWGIENGTAALSAF